jgi:hypothetical protein
MVGSEVLVPDEAVALRVRLEDPLEQRFLTCILPVGCLVVLVCGSCCSCTLSSSCCSLFLFHRFEDILFTSAHPWVFRDRGKLCATLSELLSNTRFWSFNFLLDLGDHGLVWLEVCSIECLKRWTPNLDSWAESIIWWLSTWEHRVTRVLYQIQMFQSRVLYTSL